MGTVGEAKGQGDRVSTPFRSFSPEEVRALVAGGRIRSPILGEELQETMSSGDLPEGSQACLGGGRWIFQSRMGRGWRTGLWGLSVAVDVTSRRSPWGVEVFEAFFMVLFFGWWRGESLLSC